MGTITARACWSSTTRSITGSDGADGSPERSGIRNLRKELSRQSVRATPWGQRSAFFPFETESRFDRGCASQWRSSRRERSAPNIPAVRTCLQAHRCRAARLPSRLMEGGWRRRGVMEWSFFPRSWRGSWAIRASFSTTPRGSSVSSSPRIHSDSPVDLSIPKCVFMSFLENLSAPMMVSAWKTSRSPGGCSRASSRLHGRINWWLAPRKEFSIGSRLGMIPRGGSHGTGVIRSMPLPLMPGGDFFSAGRDGSKF